MATAMSYDDSEPVLVRANLSFGDVERDQVVVVSRTRARALGRYVTILDPDDDVENVTEGVTVGVTVQLGEPELTFEPAELDDAEKAPDVTP